MSKACSLTGNKPGRARDDKSATVDIQTIKGARAYWGFRFGVLGV